MNNAVTPHVLQRIRAEYLEMPGLTLRAEQVQRLCGLDHTLCQRVLEALVESGFLSRRPDGAYGRFSSLEIARARPAKAGLETNLLPAAARHRARAS